MTENQNLRALLAEARKFWKICNCGNDECKWVSDLCRRIDAALAKPVARLSPYDAAVAEMRGDAWQREALRFERERDEARAEVERLRALTGPDGELEAFAREQYERAYRRGAEAMREAAARHVESHRIGDDQATLTLVARVYAKDIRALPIPEDK